MNRNGHLTDEDFEKVSELKYLGASFLDLKEVQYEGDWKILAQDSVTWRAYVLMATNLRFHNASELVRLYHQSIFLIALIIE